MGGKRNEPKAIAGIGRWIGLQIAAQAFKWAIGLPVVTGVVMAALAYANNLPLAWGFFGVLGASAFMATFMNQARAFTVSYNVAGKFHSTDVVLDRGLSRVSNKEGYRVGVIFRNVADIPLEYSVTRASASVGGRVVEHEPITTGSEVIAGKTIGYMIGAAPMERVCSEHMFAEIEIEYAYGRPGKLKHRRVEKFTVAMHMSDSGEVAAKSIYIKD